MMFSSPLPYEKLVFRSPNLRVKSDRLIIKLPVLRIDSYYKKIPHLEESLPDGGFTAVELDEQEIGHL